MTKRKPLSKRTRFEIFKRDGFTCRYCAQKPPEVMLVVDHIVPVVEGGTDDPSNPATACQTCNQGKAGIPLGAVHVPQNDEAVLALAQEMAEQRYGFLVQQEQQQALDSALEESAAVLCRQWRDIGGSEDCFDVRSARTIIRAGGLVVACEAMEKAGTWWDRNQHKSQPNAWKYFCGVAWRIIKESKSPDA